MKRKLTKTAAASLLLAGSMVLCQCGGGSLGNIKASNYTPTQLAANSRGALSGHYKSNPTLRRHDLSRFSPSSVISRFR